ncbi:hypothetical protein RQP46_010848 [Phenoliferia psychrophenolica]
MIGSIPTLAAVLHDETILVTGGAGFVGSSVLLRLLQSLSPKRVVALVRGVDPISRLHPSLKLLTAAGTAGLSSARLVVLPGDVSQVGFGLNKEYTKTLDDLRPTIVLHCAADIKFTRPLAEAFSANTRMAYVMAEYSARTPSVVTHVHVSTCYDTYVLPDGETAAEELHFSNNVPLVEHANTYAQSKAAAEGIVDSFARVGTTVSWSVIRLSTITPAFQSPSPVWGAASLSSPICSVLAAEVLPASSYNTAMFLDCVPVDLCANQILGLLAVAHRGERHSISRPSGWTVPVYHVASTDIVLGPSLWNLPHVKIDRPYVSVTVMEHTYRAILSKAIYFDSTRTRAVLGMPALVGRSSSLDQVVSMDGFDVSVAVGFQRFGGEDKYLCTMRDAMNEAIAKKAKARQAAKAAVAQKEVLAKI